MAPFYAMVRNAALPPFCGYLSPHGAPQMNTSNNELLEPLFICFGMILIGFIIGVAI